MIITPWTDEERAAYLDCPECGEPAIPASSVDRKNGRLVFQWTEDDGVVCPGCKANLIAFITGDENGDFFEARVRDDGEVSK